MIQSASLALNTAAESEIRSEPREKCAVELHERHQHAETGDAKDYFVHEDGQTYAGRHLLVDFWDASNLDDCALMEATLREAAEICGATLLHVHVHTFTDNGGVSGVAVLAESHISVHTWPEIGYAAFDIFMCGACQPKNALPVLRRNFLPGREKVDQQKRGLVE